MIKVVVPGMAREIMGDGDVMLCKLFRALAIVPVSECAQLYNIPRVP